MALVASVTQLTVQFRKIDLKFSVFSPIAWNKI